MILMKPGKNGASDLCRPMESNKYYRFGIDPEKDAWVTVFFIENHLDYVTHPEHAATPEQIRFMVYTEEDDRYYPCPDMMFEDIISRNQSDFLRKQYHEVLENILDLIHTRIEDEHEKKYLESLIRIKFKHETRDEIMLPSRLEKRLLKIFMNRTLIEDPYLCEKAHRNWRTHKALNSKEFYAAINSLSRSEFSQLPENISGVRNSVDYIELKRLLSLTGETALWNSDQDIPMTEEDYRRAMNRNITGNGIDPLLDFLGVRQNNRPEEIHRLPGKILWLADEAGEVIIDFAIIRYLVKLGHKVIVAFKEGPLYSKIDFYDIQEDQTLKKELEGAFLIKEKQIGKNELVGILRSDVSVIAISDGTREEVNLVLASRTFSRCFKEVDAVISRGHKQRTRFFDTHFQFTRDVFNISCNPEGTVSVHYKPRHPDVVKFSHQDLEQRAEAIIDQMKEAKARGMTVVFYSGIVGSIPGKVKTAKKIMSVFIEHLKTQLSETFIINPSHYFQVGMDADDLMYMWEIVQRSGLIDIWRFQSYGDIMKSFELLKEKVPPEWVGKDATFSTGCTKEMTIALQVQKKHPEMQIIGPSKEKFMRRKEYGIGKMYDQRLAICKF